MSPLLFLKYVNDIWRDNESCIRLLPDGCKIYLNMLGEWAVENMSRQSVRRWR
jgi:hypothetical protein